MRLHAQLAPVFGDRLVVVFHNRPAGLALPCRVIDVNDAWLQANGLRIVPDWGWRCGDYFLYALRAALPQADHLWLIEPDCLFTGDPSAFFAAVASHDADFLGVKIAPMDPGHRFSRGLKGMAHWKSIFAFTRFSGRAVDRLMSLRQTLSREKMAQRFWPNDEVFCVSHIMAAPDLRKASLCDIAPDWIRAEDVATDPDILIDTLQGQTAPGLYHPVRARDGFRRAVAARIAQNMGFLGAMRASLAMMTEEDIAAIAADVGARCAEQLREAGKASA